MTIDYEDDVFASEHERFRSAVRRKAWGTVADLVRPYIKTDTGEDDVYRAEIFGNWLAEGTWINLDQITPQQIAEEWDNLDHF